MVNDDIGNQAFGWSTCSSCFPKQLPIQDWIENDYDPNKNQEKMLTSEIALYCLDGPQILLNIFRQKQSHILGFKVGESAVALLVRMSQR